MRIDRTFIAALMPLVLGAVVAGCGGGEPGAGGGTGARTAMGGDAASTVPEPPDGVPAGTRPLPLPVKGEPYDNPQPRENVRDGGTLTLPVAVLGPQFNLFHVDATGYISQDVMHWLAPELWDYSVAGEISPNEDYLLSAELVSTDPQVVKYTMNPEARFNDGTPIDWKAFEATWKTQNGEDPRYNPNSTVGFSSIESVEPGERPNEVVVRFKEPFYPFEMVFQNLEHPRNADPDLYKTGWINEVHNDMLAGPFVVESLDEQRVVLVPNERWWGDPPKLERVVYRQMEDSASINAFQNGEVDATGVGTADRLEQISRMQNVKVRRGFDTRTTVYTMGQDSAFFKDDAARRAFVLGTDRSLLARIRFQGMNWEEEPPGSSLVYPWQDGYRDNIPDLHFDPDKAAHVLDTAGWVMGSDGIRRKDGQLAEFTYVTFGDDPTIAALARAQQAMSKDIGLKMDIDTRRSADFGRTMSNGDFDVVIMVWSGTDPFGYVWACQIYCSDSESNYSGLGNAELDERLKAAGRIADRQRAIAVANEAEVAALHLFGTFPLFNGPRQIAVKQGLANYGPAGFHVADPQDIGWQK